MVMRPPRQLCQPTTRAAAIGSRSERRCSLAVGAMLNLTASTKSNQQLQRELEEAQRVEPAFETVASAPAFNGGNGGGGGGLPATAAGAAARRRRAFELASAEQRRRVELKAAWQSADRARKEEVRNTTSLQQRLEHAEAVHSIDMGLLQSELRASEHESAHFIAGAELKLARSCLENEAELELQEQLHVLTVRSCEKQGQGRRGGDGAVKGRVWPARGRTKDRAEGGARRAAQDLAGRVNTRAADRC